MYCAWFLLVTFYTTDPIYFFCHQRFCGFRCIAVLWRPFWWRALWLWVNFKYFHWTCSMNTYFLSSWDMTDGERKLSTYQFRKPCSQLKKSDFVTDSSLTPAYPCNTPTWNWKLLRGQLWKWLNTIINCWRPCEWTLSTRGFLRSKMSSEYFLRRPCEWLRSTCEYRKPLEKRGGWVGSVWGTRRSDFEELTAFTVVELHALQLSWLKLEIFWDVETP